MSLVILSLIDSITKLFTVLVASQTPEQQKILWDRYIQTTDPLHRLFNKLENIG